MGIGSEAEIDIFLFWFEIKIIVQSIFISKQSMIFYYLICPYIPYMVQIAEIRFLDSIPLRSKTNELTL